MFCPRPFSILLLVWMLAWAVKAHPQGQVPINPDPSLYTKYCIFEGHGVCIGDHNDCSIKQFTANCIGTGAGTWCSCSKNNGPGKSGFNHVKCENPQCYICKKPVASAGEGKDPYPNEPDHGLVFTHPC